MGLSPKILIFPSESILSLNSTSTSISVQFNKLNSPNAPSNSFAFSPKTSFKHTADNKSFAIVSISLRDLSVNAPTIAPYKPVNSSFSSFYILSNAIDTTSPTSILATISSIMPVKSIIGTSLSAG